MLAAMVTAPTLFVRSHTTLVDRRAPLIVDAAPIVLSLTVKQHFSHVAVLIVNAPVVRRAEMKTAAFDEVPNPILTVEARLFDTEKLWPDTFAATACVMAMVCSAVKPRM